jgi:hypothetical protein
MHANNTAAATTRMEDGARKLLRNVIISYISKELGNGK